MAFLNDQRGFNRKEKKHEKKQQQRKRKGVSKKLSVSYVFQKSSTIFFFCMNSKFDEMNKI